MRGEKIIERNSHFGGHGLGYPQPSTEPKAPKPQQGSQKGIPRVRYPTGKCLGIVIVVKNRKKKRTLWNTICPTLRSTGPEGPPKQSRRILPPSDTPSDTLGDTLRDNSSPRDACSRLGASPPLRLHPPEKNTSTDPMGKRFHSKKKTGWCPERTPIRACRRAQGINISII